MDETERIKGEPYKKRKSMLKKQQEKNLFGVTLQEIRGVVLNHVRQWRRLTVDAWIVRSHWKQALALAFAWCRQRS